MRATQYAVFPSLLDQLPKFWPPYRHQTPRPSELTNPWLKETANQFMNEYLGIEDWDAHCIVCGKSVEQGGGMCQIKVEGRMIALCCPLCIETFNKDPKHYVGLRAAIESRPPKERSRPESPT